MNIWVFETAHDLDDRVDFANVGQKFVAQSFALRRSFHQPGDIHELDGRWDNDGSFGDPGQHFQAGIRHRHNPDIRINGAKRIIRRLRLAGAGDRIKKGGFAYIRQARQFQLSAYIKPTTRTYF